MNRLRKLDWFVFKHQTVLMTIIRVFTSVLSILVIASLIYRYGFIHNNEKIVLINGVTKLFYLFYFISFLFRLTISQNRVEFLKVNVLETILLIAIFYDALSYYIFNQPLIENLFIKFKIENYHKIYHFIIQFFLLALAIVELLKSINKTFNSKLKPTTLFIYSFIFLIFLGGALLTLPGFNYTGQYLNFVDALFTSASASCVTGLTVVNTATFFNIKGQFIIFCLIQLGGIGILTFASFFASFIKKGIGVRHQIAMSEILDSDSLNSSLFLIKRILVMTFVIEAFGALGIYMLWGDYPFYNEADKIWASVFHSVSAFCNAGFSTLEYNFETPIASDLYMLHIFIGVIVVFGGIGFPVIRDVFSPLKLRERMKAPWKKWSLSTKIAVYTSLVLTILGTIAFYFLHVDSLTHIKSPLGKFAASFFQSVNTRTSGFNSINLENLSNTTILITIFLMFVGASSSSTGGGIKTSTFVVVFMAVIGTIRGKSEMTLDKRTISVDLIYKAFAVVIFSGIFVLTIITTLSFTEPNLPIMKVAYETVSAFATVGLSTGITSSLSDIGKLILTFSMFIGRVGILTLAFSLSSRAVTRSYSYANTHIMIG